MDEITSIEYHPDDLSKPLVICYDNILDKHPNTEYFLNTLKKREWEYCVVSVCKEWRGFKDKIEGTMLKLEQLPDDKIVVFSDTRDVVCCRHPRAFMKGFQSFQTDMVICVEIFCNETTQSVTRPRPCCIPLKDYWAYHKINPWPVRKFVNSGLIIGKAKALREFYTWAYLRKERDDQMALAMFMNLFPDKMKCDTNALLLHTSGFGKMGGLNNVVTQGQDSPTLAELFGRAAFFLHVHNHNFPGQKIIYDTVRTILDSGVCAELLNKPYQATEDMCEWQANLCREKLKPEDFE